MGSDLGSVEDAAGYHLRQQLRACRAERDQALKALLERDQAVAAAKVERDQAVAAAAELRFSGLRSEAQSLRTEAQLQKARLRIRAAVAAERRSAQRSKRPARGEFEIPSDYAVPSNVSQRGALDTQVTSTDSMSKEGRPGQATDTLRDRVQKRSRLMSAACTTLRYETTKRRTNGQGALIGGVGFSTRNQIEAFRRFSEPGFKSHATVGRAHGPS